MNIMVYGAAKRYFDTPRYKEILCYKGVLIILQIFGVTVCLMMQSLAFIGNHCFQYKHVVGHGTEKVF